MNGDQNSVVITTREIYDQVIRASKKIDVVISQQQEMIRDVADHEARVRSLEKARWPLPSLAVIVSLAALVLGLLRSSSGQ